LNTAIAGGLLLPGESVTVEIQGNGRFNRLSITSMLIPTNDTFVGLRSMKLPSRSSMAAVPAFDAGTETNDEDCTNIPGPDCGGEGYNVAGGEGFVYISNGISGIDDLAPSAFDWRNPVARVVVKHVQ
ncbi:MAG: spondin domain-containing protein, partial [Xanthomonadales bacterium]